MTLYEYDREQAADSSLCGIDEAGRGPLAGPVVAAAVILPLDVPIDGINDSKKLSPKKRETLYQQICQTAKDYSIGTATVAEIEEYNILQATFLAMRRALEGLRTRPQLVLVDGNQNPRFDCPTRLVVHGDAVSANIAAASILAKVTRDHMMIELDKQYPMYDFAKHKGYGTKRHYETLLEYGISPIHRRSFLKKFQQKNPSLSLYRGKFGEKMAYAYLRQKGYSVLARNYRSNYGEIDLIVTKGDSLLFVEVKLRDKNCNYRPCEAVTISKQKKIIQTASCFLQEHSGDWNAQFAVMEIYQTGPESCSIQLIENAFEPEEGYVFF